MLPPKFGVACPDSMLLLKSFSGELLFFLDQTYSHVNLKIYFEEKQLAETYRESRYCTIYIFSLLC